MSDIEATAAGLVRVSTTEQATEGVSIAAQEAAVRAYCQLRGLQLVEVIVDAGVSGAKALANRDGGRRLLDLIKRKQVRHVVAWKLDRLFRNASDCLATTAAWDKLGVSLHLVDLGGQTLDTSTPMGRFFLTVMAGAAELERGMIAERTKAALAHKKARGERTGSVPFGKQLSADGRALVVQEHEQMVIAEARQLRASGLPLREVGRELWRRGYRSRTGNLFDPSQVRRMLAA